MLLAGFLLLAGAVLGTYLLFQEARRADAWVVHTVSAEERLSRVLSRLQDAETGQRGYLVTGDALFLAPYADGRAKLGGEIRALEAAVADNPAQRRAAARLAQCAGRRMAMLGTSIALMRAGREAAARGLVGTADGERVMRECRAIVEGMKAAEAELLTVRIARAARLGVLLNAWLALSALAVAAIAFLATRAAGRRASAAAAARDELARANARLEQEAASRQAAEAELRQLQKMESIGQLTGGIAHDFNNMLAVVIGSLDLARRRIGKDPERLAQNLDAAMTGAQRAAQLTAQLLAFGRRQPLAPAPVDASQLVRRLSELLRRMIGPAIALRVEPTIGVWPSYADPGQLESALVNLCVNARDAMPGGGTITVRTANVHLDQAYAARHPDVTPGDYVRIAVQDSGGGMTPAVLERAFEPFFTTKTDGKGSGLGLSQVYGFVKQSGGHVGIESVPGRGTQVCLFLPRHLGQADTGPAAPAPAPVPAGTAISGARDGEIVLVVEDEDQLRALGVEALRELGYIVLSAPGGDAALALLRSQPRVDLLLTDVLMPGMSGRALAHRVAESRPGMPVLFMSGYPRDAIVHEGVLEPGVDLIAKPFDLAVLAARVRRAIDGMPADAA
jgi:signal transduction histidine kinase/ActR/RegA family two-component response regulator